MLDMLAQAVPATPGGIVITVTALLESWTGTVVGALAGWLAHALPVVVTLAFVVYGFSLWLGLAELKLGEIAGRMLSIIFLIAFTLATSLYFPFLFNFFVDGPEQIVTVILIAVGEFEAPMNTLDRIWVESFSVVTQIWAQGGWGNFAAYILAGLIMLASFLFVLTVFALILLAKIATSVLIALTPLMIFAIPFKTTRSMFERWLGALCTFALTPILAYMVAALLMGIAVMAIDPTAAGAASEPVVWDLKQVLPYFAICVLGFVVLLQTPAIAATIGGGIGLAGAGAVVGAAAAIGAAVSRAGVGLASSSYTLAGGRRPVAERREYVEQRMRTRVAGRIAAEDKAKSPKESKD